MKQKKRKARQKPVSKPKVHTAAHVEKKRLHAHSKVEAILEKEFELQTKDMFFPKHWTFSNWVKRYSPVIVTTLIGLGTYFYLTFYLFYPEVILHGNYAALLVSLIFIFALIGIFIHMGLRSELLFMRVLSFVFVFMVFTFVVMFILIAYSLKHGMIQ